MLLGFIELLKALKAIWNMISLLIPLISAIIIR
jgi:hypothetical protein